MTNETDRIEADINRSRHALNDTIEALGGKLTPGQIVDEAMGLLQGQAGKFTADLGRQVRDNPVPLLLIAAGAALLFANRQHAKSSLPADDDDAHTRYNALESARAGITRDSTEDESAWSHRLHEVEAKALDLKQGAGEAVEAFKARVKSAGEALGRKAAGARERLASGYSSAMHAVSDGAAGIGHFAADQAAHAKHAASDLKHKAQDLYDENPLAVGAIGLALGAVIGGLTPLSSVERDKLQGLADAAKDKGAGLAELGARAVEKIADKAISAVH